MTITIAGRKLKADPPALLRQYYERPEIKRPRFMLVCEKCRSLCTIGIDCDCCRDYGTKGGGTGRVIRTMSPHGRLPIAEVLEVLQAAVAA